MSSKKQQQIKQSVKKSKLELSEWERILSDLLEHHKKEFSIWRRLICLLKKLPHDPETPVCRELILRMDRKRLTFEEAQQMVSVSTARLKALQSDLPKLLLHFLGGLVLFVLAFGLAASKVPYSLQPSDWVGRYDLVFYFAMLGVNTYIFVTGLSRRNRFDVDLKLNSILAQSGAAYAAARSPGRGGTIFEANRMLELLRERNRTNMADVFRFGKRKE